MEAGNQTPSDTTENACQPNENGAEGGDENKSPAATNSEQQPMITEDSTRDEQAGTSSECNGTESGMEKLAVRRNYRRRTGEPEESSSDDAEIAEPPPVENNEEAQQQEQQSSDSEDVSLDDLRVSASEDNNRSIRR